MWNISNTRELSSLFAKLNCEYKVKLVMYCCTSTKISTINKVFLNCHLVYVQNIFYEVTALDFPIHVQSLTDSTLVLDLTIMLSKKRNQKKY